MGARLKGVSSLKTMSAVRGSGAHSNERHVHQFQIASLELERTRRVQEQEAALRRLKNLEVRVAEIDALIRKHQEALGAVVPAAPDAAPLTPDAAPASEPKAEPAEKRRTLRY